MQVSLPEKDESIKVTNDRDKGENATIPVSLEANLN